MTPFSIAAALQLPGDTSLPLESIPFNVSSQYASRETSVLVLTGSGTKSVGLGSISDPGLNALLIKMDPSATAQPIQVQINGSVTGALEISPGGGFLYVNPGPATGITSLDIVHATACTVRIWALGP